MSSRGLLVALAVSVAALVRLLPSVAAGLYYSTDVWPLIRYAERMVERPDLRFWDHSELGGYHNRWPAAMVSGALYSVVTGLGVAPFFRYAGVLTVSVCLTLLVYAAAARASGPRRASVSSLVLSAAPSFVVFTAATLKEVYSYPIAAALAVVAARGPPRRSLLPVLVLSLALAVSHPLTPVVLASAAASYAFARAVRGGGARGGEGAASAALAVSALVAAAYATYGVCYSWEGLKYRLGLYDMVSLATVATAVYGWYALNRASRVGCSLLLAPLALAAVVSGSAGLLKASTVAYALVPAALLLTLLPKGGGAAWAGVLDSLILPVVAATLYIFLAQPALVPIAHRVLNYLVFAAALAPALSRPGSRVLASVQLVVLLAGVGLSVAALTVGDPTTYYWVYREAEVSALRLAPLLPAGVCGDAKVEYLMEPEVEVGALCGVEALRDLRRAGPLVLYADNFRYGYVLSPVDVFPVPSLESVSGRFDLLYSSLYLFVWG